MLTLGLFLFILSFVLFPIYLMRERITSRLVADGNEFAADAAELWFKISGVRLPLALAILGMVLMFFA